MDNQVQGLDNLNNLIRLKTVAKALGVHPRTVWRWIDRGKINAYQLPSGEFRFTLEQVKQILTKAGRWSDEDGQGSESIAAGSGLEAAHS